HAGRVEQLVVQPPLLHVVELGLVPVLLGGEEPLEEVDPLEALLLFLGWLAVAHVYRLLGCLRGAPERTRPPVLPCRFLVRPLVLPPRNHRVRPSGFQFSSMEGCASDVNRLRAAEGHAGVSAETFHREIRPAGHSRLPLPRGGPPSSPADVSAETSHRNPPPARPSLEPPRPGGKRWVVAVGGGAPRHAHLASRPGGDPRELPPGPRSRQQRRERIAIPTELRMDSCQARRRRAAPRHQPLALPIRILPAATIARRRE